MAKSRNGIYARHGLCRVCQHDRVKRGDSVKVRAEKKKLSSAAQQKMNRKNSAIKLKFLLAENFKPGDLVVGLDFAPEHRPWDRDEVKKILKKFRAQLSKEYKALGLVLLMVWCIEHKHGDGHWHLHIVINATGDDLDRLKRLWTYGGVHMEKLRVDKEKNYATLANYMAKEAPDKLSQRSWSYTRSCKQPEVDNYIVTDDTPLQVPKGAIVLEHIKQSNQYGSFELIEYYIPNGEKVKARRKRKIKR